MKRSFLFVLLCCSTALARETNLVVPGRSVGPITGKFTRADLIKAFGADNVKNVKVSLGEGETAPGAAVYPKDPKRRLEIVWTEKGRVQDVRFSGRSSVWHTADGVSLGTTVAELERLNGKPFKFYGFGWDYGGLVESWEKGQLEKRLKGMSLTLDPAADLPEGQMIGDGAFWSNEAIQKKYSIVVGQIRVQLAP